jgi:hypothetical protein
MKRLLFPIRLLLALTCLGGVWPVCAAAAADDADDQRVSQFLDRLGLTEIEILHLEKMLGQALPAARRNEVGKKLADLYAARLMAAAGDPQQSQQMLARIEALIRNTPEVNTPALQVMLLQADYNRAELLLTQWIADRADDRARDEARKILEEITPQLNEYQVRLNAQVETAIDALNDAPEGEARDAQEQQLLRQQAVAGRATFFAGWSNYYLGLVQGASAAAQFNAARTAFRQLLEIGETDYASLDAEWLGLESPWRARAMIGLGLAEAATGELTASAACFRLLRQASVPPEIQDEAPYWYVQGLLNAGRYDTARAYAAEQVAAYNGDASRGKFSLCVSLVRAGFGPGADGSASERRELGLIGLRGLARLGQQNAVRQLIEQYDIQLEDGGGFQLRWIQARRLLAAAEQSKRVEDYQAAATALQAALSAPDADQQITAAAQCRYELAWCLFQQGDYERAAREYQQAVIGLKTSDRDSAARAAWMVFAAYQKLMTAQPTSRTAAIEALRLLQRDFPGHPYAQRADYYISKLSRPGSSPEDTIADLEKIPPAASAYSAARYDICLLRHEIWSRAEAVDKAAAAGRLVDDVERYLSSADEAEPSRRLKCCLLVADTALSGPPVDLGLAEQYLDKAAALAAKVSADDIVVAEYHYRALQLAGKAGDDPQRQSHAQWLVQNAAGSVYELPALVVAANAVDRTLATASQDRQAALRDEAIDIYGRLVTLLGDSAETIADKKNARVAISKLADHQSDAGQYDAAAGWLEKLLAVYPANQDYLRRAALAHFQSGALDRSLPHWRSLLAGVERNSDAWYEAKYYQLRCLLSADPEAGRRVLEQFRLLYPDLGPESWRERFRELVAQNR